MLEASIRKYKARAIESAKVIEELIAILADRPVDACVARTVSTSSCAIDGFVAEHFDRAVVHLERAVEGTFIFREPNLCTLPLGFAHLFRQTCAPSSGCRRADWHDRIEAAERIIANMRNPPTIEFGGSRAFYSSSADRITLPPRELFSTAEKFYATLNHETAHYAEFHVMPPDLRSGIARRLNSEDCRHSFSPTELDWRVQLCQRSTDLGFKPHPGTEIPRAM